MSQLPIFSTDLTGLGSRAGTGGKTLSQVRSNAYCVLWCPMNLGRLFFPSLLFLCTVLGEQVIIMKWESDREMVWISIQLIAVNKPRQEYSSPYLTLLQILFCWFNCWAWAPLLHKLIKLGNLIKILLKVYFKADRNLVDWYLFPGSVSSTNLLQESQNEVVFIWS